MVLFVAAIVLLSAMAGAAVASLRQRNVVAWFVLSAVLPVLPPLLLLVLPKGKPRRDRKQPAKRQPVALAQQPPRRQPARLAPPVQVAVAAPEDRSPAVGRSGVHQLEQWQLLLDYDLAIRDAMEAVAPLGPDAIDELKRWFAAQPDRALLPAMVARIRDKHMAAVRVPPRSTTYRLPSPVHRLPTPLMEAQPVRPVPQHTSVTTQDLDTATYLETYRGVHLYVLADGRIYVDGRMALPTLSAARLLIDTAGTSMAAE